MIRTLSLAALAAVLAAPMAQGQTVPAQRNPAQRPGTPGTGVPGIGVQGTPAPGNVAQAGVSDALFAAAAATGGLAELQVSELGVQKATDPELKRFSQQMIDEHSRMSQELTTLAAQKGIPLPRMTDARAQFCAQSLAGLSGREFDRCYAKAQLVLHMESVATFEAEAQRGLDPDVKALAAKALPRIQEHLRMIKPIAMRYEQEKPSTGAAPSTRPER